MVVKRMHACFLLHPGLCPGRGWTHDTKKQEGATQGPTLGQRKSFSSPHPPKWFAWPVKRRPKRAPRTGSVEAGLRGGQAHEIELRLWAGPGILPKDT